MNTRSNLRIMMANVNPVEQIGILEALSQHFHTNIIHESSPKRWSRQSWSERYFATSSRVKEYL